MADFTILDLTSTEYWKARLIWNSLDDFEDTVQVASALNFDCDLILTRDKKFVKEYSRFIQIESVK